MAFSLFDLMLEIRMNPRCLAELTGLDLDLEDEPRNISRELYGTPDAKYSREFSVVWGFGYRGHLTGIVGVSLDAREPGASAVRPELADAVKRIEEIYGVPCLVAEITNSTRHLNPMKPKPRPDIAPHPLEGKPSPEMLAAAKVRDAAQEARNEAWEALQESERRLHTAQKAYREAADQHLNNLLIHSLNISTRLRGGGGGGLDD